MNVPNLNCNIFKFGIVKLKEFKEYEKKYPELLAIMGRNPELKKKKFLRLKNYQMPGNLI